MNFIRKKVIATLSIAIVSLISVNIFAKDNFTEHTTENKVPKVARTIPTKPNIIFIFADDFGWGDISKHGHPDIRTPNIDRLAEEGSEFYQFSVSNPVCSPSRAAAITGLYPSRSSIHRHLSGFDHHQNFSMADWLDPEEVNMAKVMKSAGYKTAHFGKWHLGNIGGAPIPTEYGYDEAKVFNGNGPQTTFARLYDDAIDFMERNKDVPFFINLWIHETHTPHDPSEESLAKYQHLNEQDRIYAAVVDGADQRIGKVLKALDNLKLTENTLVVFSSDNGPEHTGTTDEKKHGDGKLNIMQGTYPYGKYYSTGSSAGLRGGKRDTYEGGLRVPFLVRWPAAVPAGRTDTVTIVTAVDLLPTFAEAAGATLPKDYKSDGQSVLSLLTGGTIQREKPMFWEWRYGKESGQKPMLAVRDGPWKLFVHQNNNNVELYNVMQDRSETRDISELYPEKVKSMKALALAWKATLPDQPRANAISPSRAKKNKKNKESKNKA
ncbi:sulfatase-like hydrolase/transferase [Colwellia sp. 6_MG-2023]|uniref:sulfatase-like hydrolase/transferase n=1 Tax=Colwellia sp. 6_MG-2023 TaxID=3062676 RepID=UPI0026E2EA41|nr:sulfatase-like hydrolase/transferase [Colwellia sp. 6_MG-2023]MDO6487555.1 sulfatase-like hydrolase/transferase [Colwellia sp. 6_MG-2023]